MPAAVVIMPPSAFVQVMIEKYSCPWATETNSIQFCLSTYMIALIIA